MAKSLIPSSTYSLLKSDDENPNVELFFVKLTDSSLKAVEEYIEYQAAIKGKPKIQFLGQNGETFSAKIIHIPSRPGSASQDVGKKFKFICSNTARDDRQGILDCIHQPNSHKNTLKSLGTLDRKISVMATDEAYELTRNRMAQADQERKEIRTKEININHPKSKKKKLTITPVGKDLNKVIKKKLNAASLTRNSNGMKLMSSNGNSQSNSRSFSYKDRIIHILALRPHKKPEILARLQREGVNQKDRMSLGIILQQVASMQDNSFKLNKHYFADLKPDTWPFYTESERTNVKENVAQIISQESSPKVSSTSTSPDNKGIKRHLNNNNNNYSPTNAKKPRIAKPLQDPSTSSSHVLSKANLNIKDESSKRNLEIRKEKETKIGHSTSMKHVSNISDKKSNGNLNDSPPVVASTTETPEHLLKYQPIKSYDQRCKYKQDFQAEYGKYRELKENVDNISKKFLELDRVRRKYPENSIEAQKIQDEIYRLYEQHQKDQKYLEMKRKCQEMHARLSHIKKLVVEYDQNIVQHA